MAIPKEAIEAAFPTPEVVGNFTFHPITSAHVLALAAIGNPVFDRTVTECDAGHIVRAAALLTWKPGQVHEALTPTLLQGRADAMVKALTHDQLADVLRVPYTLVTRGMAAFVPMRDPEDGERVSGMSIDNWGWPVVAIEFLMHEYGMKWEEAECVPLVRLFVSRALADVRRGLKPTEPSYGERAYVDGALALAQSGKLTRLSIRKAGRKNSGSPSEGRTTSAKRG